MLKNTDFPIDERGRVRVSADLRVTGDDGVVEVLGQQATTQLFRISPVAAWVALRSQRSARFPPGCCSG